jgi:hypothetical protein
MKYNYIYEIAIKKSVARSMEIKELKRICSKDISLFHRNLTSRAVTLEMLDRVPFRVIEENDKTKIEFPTGAKKTVKPISCVKIHEEKLSDLDNRKVIVFNAWKKAVMKILIKLQAYKHHEKMERSKQCRIDRSKFLTYEKLEGGRLSDDSRNSDEFDNNADS